MIPSYMAGEPSFVQKMYGSLISALETEGDSFSRTDFIQKYVGIQDPEAENLGKITILVIRKIFEEQSQYREILEPFFRSMPSIAKASSHLLRFAESLRREGAMQSDIEFFQKYAFRLGMLSIQQQGEFSDREYLEKGLEQFELLRTYRNELPQVLQMESKEVLELIKKILPKRFLTPTLEGHAAELQVRIQDFLNRNLYKLEEGQTFSSEEFPPLIHAHIRENEGDLICYHERSSSSFGAYLAFSMMGKTPAFHACKIEESETRQNQDLSIRNIPDVEEFFTPDPVWYQKEFGFLVRRSFDWEPLDRIMQADPFAFSGLEQIEICQQILRALEKLANYRYMPSYFGLEQIAICKTAKGVEARFRDLEAFGFFEAQKRDFKSLFHKFLMKEFSSFLTKNLLGIDELHQDWEEKIFHQLEKVVTAEEFQNVLLLKKHCDRFGESFVKSLQEYRRTLRNDFYDIFSLSAIGQLIERWIILECMQPLSWDLSFIQALEVRLDLAKDRISELFLDREKTKVQSVSKSHLFQYIPYIESENQLHLLHDMICSFLEEHNYVGSDLRFHRGDLWKGQEIPFSFRLHVEKNQVVWTIFPPNSKKTSAMGEKSAWQMQFFPHGATGLIPIDVFRDIDYTFAKQRRDLGVRARAILKIPGASRYFASPPETQLSYETSKKGKKWETFSERYPKNLLDLTIENQVEVLLHLLQGIKLIAQQGLIHGEIHPDNVGVYSIFEEVRARFLWKMNPHLSDPLHYNNLRKHFGELSVESDIYAFVLLLATTLLSDLGRVAWEVLEPEEVKIELEEERKSRIEDPRIAIELQIEDAILLLLEQTKLADLGAGSFPSWQEIEDVLTDCLKVLEEPFAYLHPIFAVEPISTESREEEHDG